jgi:predicted Zn-dependent protease with MMP-like domain
MADEAAADGTTAVARVRVVRSVRPRQVPVAVLARTGRAADNGRVEMTQDEFEALVGDALDTIPAALARMMDNVAVFVESEPAADDPELLGLYEGTPLTERSEWYAGVLPDRITVYMGPTLRICESREEVVAEVRTTVVHEVGHHFGIGDERLHELGWA